MKIRVPDEVRQAINNADLAEFARNRAKKVAEEKERKRVQKIEELRHTRADELRKYAERVFDWREAFVRTEEAKRIWELIGEKTRLVIFGARYWRGEPALADERHVWAVLAFESWPAGRIGLPSFWYEERYQSSHGVSIPCEIRITAQQGLIDTVHPDFLKELYEHLNGPDTWKFILQELRRFSKR